MKNNFKKSSQNIDQNKHRQNNKRKKNISICKIQRKIETKQNETKKNTNPPQLIYVVRVNIIEF